MRELQDLLLGAVSAGHGKEVCTNPVSFLTKAIRAATLTRWGHIRDILKGGKNQARTSPFTSKRTYTPAGQSQPSQVCSFLRKQNLQTEGHTQQ